MGIQQGSVLSPIPFKLDMDPLLIELKSRNLGLSVNYLYLGAFVHVMTFTPYQLMLLILPNKWRLLISLQRTRAFNSTWKSVALSLPGKRESILDQPCWLTS